VNGVPAQITVVVELAGLMVKFLLSLLPVWLPSPV
jgi:hypothetical protein